jgi:outer membrane lipoprotein SlyB
MQARDSAFKVHCTRTDSGSALSHVNAVGHRRRMLTDGPGRCHEHSLEETVAVVGIVTVLEACAFRSGTTYAPEETGTVMREEAHVVSSREVVIAGLDNKQAAGWGTVVGGAMIAGAAAYGITEADNPPGVAITIIASVVGGLAGLAAEERRETRPGAEYILRDDSGKTFAVVQSLGGGETIYPPGTAVSLIHGSRGYVRVVPAEVGGALSRSARLA